MISSHKEVMSRHPRSCVAHRGQYAQLQGIFRGVSQHRRQPWNSSILLPMLLHPMLCVATQGPVSS
ncbi:hypothetical protein J1N35_034689 [Gossypium stocksii]|uniref:Uncharacterized protein n=1 Tax=Gossypium stocksii TaxID=47602 RepID=A0A9D3UTC7_9ROSI|nr:hypothetical protein J1N35_034689 [Gossypium stocksii]